jgi:hypothetical protein
MWAGKWLECRIWEEEVPVTATEVRGAEDRSDWVWLHERTAEFRAWQRIKPTSTDSRGGWWFPSKLPPLTAAEASLNEQAHSLDAAPAKVTHSISHDGGRQLLCVEHDDAGDRRAQPEKIKEVWE